MNKIFMPGAPASVPIGTIYETNDYNAFKKLDTNRDVKQDRIEKIVESIETIGVMAQPILCNEKMEVIDGQGRLEALRKLGLPVWYTIQPNIGIDECRTMNLNQTNWTTTDFVNSFATEGKKPYILLKELIEEFPQYTVTFIAAVARGISGSGSGSAKMVRSGKYNIGPDEYEYARDRLNFITPYWIFARAQGYLYLEKLMQALIYIKDCGVDEQRLWHIFTTRKLSIYNNVATALDAIECQYNKGLKKNLLDAFSCYRKEMQRKGGADKRRETILNKYRSEMIGGH